MDPTSDSTKEPIASLRPRRWFTPFQAAAVLAALIAGVLVLMFAARPLYRVWQLRQARAMAAAAVSEMDAGRMEQASKLVSEAFKQNSTDPIILRSMARLIHALGGDPAQEVFVWRKLLNTGAATSQDRAGFGCALIVAGQPDEAHKVFATIPSTERATRAVLELEAMLLEADGEPARARDVRRRAWLLDPDNPECALELAALDMMDPFPETRDHAIERTWTLARGQGVVALRAITMLAGNRWLTAAKARELLDIVEKNHPDAAVHRYAVLSAVLRLSPTERKSVIAREVTALKEKRPEDSLDAYRWLLAEGEHLGLLSLITPEKVGRTQGLFPVYAEALAAAGRWDQLRQSLRQTSNMPVSPADFALLQARCAKGLNESTESIAGHLREACRRALASQHGPTFQRATRITESLGYQDVVLESLREASSSPQFRQMALERALEIHLRQRNAAAILTTLRDMQTVRPGVRAYQHGVLYLKLLIGIEMESAAAQLRDQIAGNEIPAPTAAFLQALAAFRMSDTEALRQHLAQVDPSSITAGQRAVYAGMLHAIGEPAKAFAVAERVPRPLLLAEEDRFLARAL